MIRFHDLRHSGATQLLASGYNMKCVSEWLGHCDIHTTMNIYAHVTNQTKQSMANCLGALLETEPVEEEKEKPAAQPPANTKVIHFPQYEQQGRTRVD